MYLKKIKKKYDIFGDFRESKKCRFNRMCDVLMKDSRDELKYCLSKENDLSDESYENVLNICFANKPELIKFDSNSTDKEIDDFFESINNVWLRFW